MFNLQKGSANKDYQETNNYNKFPNNSDNEKLNNDKSEIYCRNGVHINNRQSWDRVKSSQPESSNCPSKNNNNKTENRI